MEKQDQEFGIWFGKGIYYFSNDVRVWINVNYDACVCSRKALEAKYPETARFFGHGAVPKHTVSFYREGRNWYWIHLPRIDRPLLSYSGTLSPEYEKLAQLDSKVFSLASLICGSFGKDPYADLLRGECSPIGDRIARSLVRTAATRIFNEPEQSIMELPVNSIDSYFPEKSVGKFGMGFFSILYWLIGTKRTLSIKSFCLDSEDRSYAYDVIIFFDGELKFKLKPFLSYTPLTGTCIDLDASAETFPNQTARLFLDYISRLDYADASVTCLSSYPSQNHINPSYDSNIYVKIRTDLIRVEDYGTGISSDVLLTKLFIPSVSTKTIQSSVEKEPNIPTQEIIIDRGVRFSIIVNGIILKDFTSAGLKGVHRPSYSTKILWKLPSNTKVPVSRDDVILDEDIARATLNDLFDLAVKNNVVDVLQYWLKKYASKTTYSNSLIVRKIMDEQIKRYRAIFIPSGSDINLFYAVGVNSFDYDLGHVREVFVKILKTDPRVTYIGELFYAKQVFSVVPNVLPYFTGRTPFLDILLVDESFMKDPDWKSVISATYFNQGKLVPSEGKHIKESDRIKVQIETLDSLLKALESRANVTTHKKDVKVASIIAHTFKESSSRIFDIVNSYLSTYTPEYTYSKRSVRLWPSILNLENIMKKTSGLANKSLKYRDIIFNLHKDCLSLSDPGDEGAKFWFNSITVSKENVCRFVADHVSSHLHYEYLMAFVELEMFKFEDVVKRFDIINDKVKLANPSIFELKVLIFYGVVSPFHASIRNFIRSTLNEKRSKYKAYTPSMIKGPTISNVDLINYLFDVSKPLSFDDLPRIDAWKPKRSIKLQTLEIAVNEGTTRPFIDAVMTECFQNSLDAIRKSKVPDPYVDFSVKFYPETNPNYMVLEISDPVGMSIESFLYISVPFLSTKDNSDPAYTGEMGTGFFNVYRESSKVRILTRPPDDKNTYVWEDIPIRKNGRVVDIRKTFSKTHELSGRGTRIEIHMPYTKVRNQKTCPPLKDFADYVEINELISKRFSFTTEKLKIMPSMGIPSAVMVYTIGKMQFYYTYDDGSFMSFVYTNGVPTMPLTDLQPYAVSHILINILPGGYVPRQSRTHLDLGENASDFNRIKLMAQAYAALYLNLIGRSTYAVDSTLQSKSDVQSVLPGVGEFNNLSNGCIHYDFPGYGSMSKALTEGARVCQFDPQVPENMEKLKKWTDDTFKGEDLLSRLFRDYILLWFKNKTTVVNQRRMAEDLRSETQSKTLSLLTELYVNIGAELGIKGFGPKVKAIAPLEKGRSFSTGDKIVVYTASDPSVEQIFYKGFAHYSAISNGPWFELYGPMGTFTHEMEHVRRHTSTKEGDGQHESVSGPLWKDDQINSRDFGRCQLDVYTKIVKEGRLWQRFDELLAKN